MVIHRLNFEWEIEEFTLNLLQPNGLKFFIQDDSILVTGSDWTRTAQKRTRTPSTAFAKEPLAGITPVLAGGTTIRKK